MKIFNLKFAVFALSLSIFFLAGCDKDDDPAPDGNNNNGGEVNAGDAFGTLVAIRSITYTNAGGNLIPFEFNTATAAFFEAVGGSALVDAGAVQLNGKTLTKATNNAYSYDNALDPLSLDQVQWEVAGSGDVPMISQTVTKPLPEFTGYENLPASVSKAEGLTISLGASISDADSVLVTVISINDGEFAMRTVAGNAGSVTFNTDDLAGLSTGSGLLQVNPYNVTTETISGKKSYFLNQSSYSKADFTIE
jgi:hypothetical protein